MYLLDTNVISELRKIKNGNANSGVIEWAKNTPSQLFFTSAVCLMELERGILRIERKDKVQAENLRRWFNGVKQIFEARILGVDAETASVCAKLHIPDFRPENDAWIAATAIQYDFTLVTRNLKDFNSLPIKLLNPFTD